VALRQSEAHVPWVADNTQYAAAADARCQLTEASLCQAAPAVVLPAGPPSESDESPNLHVK